MIHLDGNEHLLRGYVSLNQREASPWGTNATSAFKPSLVCGKTRCFGSSSPSIRHTWWAPLPQSTPTRLKTFVISFSVSCYVVGWRTLSEPVLALVISGANFLLDVIPYRHPDAAQILGGRYTALCQALALTSENDFGTLYRPGFAPGVTDFVSFLRGATPRSPAGTSS